MCLGVLFILKEKLIIDADMYYVQTFNLVYLGLIFLSNTLSRAGSKFLKNFLNFSLKCFLNVSSHC